MVELRGTSPGELGPKDLHDISRSTVMGVGRSAGAAPGGGEAAAQVLPDRCRWGTGLGAARRPIRDGGWSDALRRPSRRRGGRTRGLPRNRDDRRSRRACLSRRVSARHHLPTRNSLWPLRAPHRPARRPVPARRPAPCERLLDARFAQAGVNDMSLELDTMNQKPAGESASASAAARMTPQGTYALPDDAVIILPVRRMVLFPGMILPVALGREASIAAAQAAAKAKKPIGVLLQRNGETEKPGPDDLCLVGTVAA